MEAALVGMWSSGNRLVIRVSCFWSSRHVNHLPIISVAPCAESSHCSKHSNRRVLVCSLLHTVITECLIFFLVLFCFLFWKHLNLIVSLLRTGVVEKSSKSAKALRHCVCSLSLRCFNPFMCHYKCQVQVTTLLWLTQLSLSHPHCVHIV